ncbi:WD40 repeat-like protein [Infundibulicybe gibba]|nr:WD40 repeat-like protein [Infundibulicybe gibba]
MQLQETILCAATPASSSTGSGLISIHDIQTGSTLASFKQSNASPHCIAVVESRNAQGGFVLAAQSDKSTLNVYSFQKDQISLKMVLPEKLTCVAVDRQNYLCAGGTAQGRIYIWEIASGIMYNSWDAHYRQVTALCFSQDGVALVSGSEDSGLSVWSVSRLLDNELMNDLPTPYCTLTDHTLPVTDIICGTGPFPTCRVLTSSMDHSAKLWDLSSRSLLTTFQFPQPISCLAWDVTESMFFAASVDGSIHQMNLFRQRKNDLGVQTTEAVGGTGVTDIVRLDDDDHMRRKRLISIGDPVTSLTISLTASLLLAGTSTGFIHLYDIRSHQLLRTISTHKGLCINYLMTMLKPPDLIGHISLHLGVATAADARDVIPVKPVVSFQRMRDMKAREAHEVAILLPIQVEVSDETTEYSAEELLADHAFFVQPSDAMPEQDTVSLRTKVSQMESEIEELREQLGKAKGVNDAMWNTVVQRVVGQGKKNMETGQASMDTTEDGNPRRKRGRT